MYFYFYRDQGVVKKYLTSFHIITHPDLRNTHSQTSKKSFRELNPKRKLWTEHLGDIEAERFIAFIQRELSDYTKWRQGLDEDLSITFTCSRPP